MVVHQMPDKLLNLSLVVSFVILITSRDAIVDKSVIIQGLSHLSNIRGVYLSSMSLQMSNCIGHRRRGNRNGVD